MSLTMRFPEYVFNEINTYVLFSRMGCLPDTPFLWLTQTLMNTSLLSLERKGNFCLPKFP